ncbi:MAG: hypothetical protein O2868_13570 [Proteobacteria bacterium]|nr:hypothetical protein [Pseudomonadota bacterium]
MFREAASTIVLILGLALTFQSAVVVDHLHVDLNEVDSCVVCTGYSSVADVPASAAAGVLVVSSERFGPFAPRRAHARPPESTARGSPASR